MRGRGTDIGWGLVGLVAVAIYFVGAELDWPWFLLAPLWVATVLALVMLLFGLSASKPVVVTWTVPTRTYVAEVGWLRALRVFRLRVRLRVDDDEKGA